MKMKLKTIKSTGLAHNSYYLSSEGEAVVIDPRRDCEIYTQLAKQECTEIKYILETHRNEDYVAGSLELQNMTHAEIGHSSTLPFKYGEHNLSDGYILKVGSVKIKTLYTPGHTNESLSYLIYSPSNVEALMVFTGDTLFAGSVGRTDLYGKTAQRTQAEKLYSSLHEKLLPLGDHVLVYPAHGAGSVCGHGISEQEPTTIGYEKKTNPYLQLGKEEFIQKASSEEFIVPKYFRKMEELNLNGAPLLSELPLTKPLLLQAFEQEMQEPNMVVIDTRRPYAYAGSHIPDSLSIWLEGNSAYTGWILDTDQHIIFVHERPTDMDKAAVYLRRMGLDNLCGYLYGGIEEWQENGKPINHIGTLSVTELLNKLDKNEVLLVDVRKPSEWEEEGTVEGARRIFFADLTDKANSLPRDKPLAVICSVGKRSSIAASILERKGFKNVSNVLGGMTAWTALGYPTKKP
jgi:hydroxyacylglutathione hydrolase